MKVRTVILCAAGLVAAGLAPLSYGKDIRVDLGNATFENCTTVSPIDSFASNVNPNVGIAVSSECDSTSGNDQALGNPFTSGNNSYSNADMYYWGGSASSTSGTLAQVVDYTLASGDESADSIALGGLTEIEFNYADCTSAGPADLTMGGTQYSAACGATADTSLLFNSTALVGWLDDSNDVHACAGAVGDCLSGSGWSTGSVASTVPEPGSLALFGLAVLPLLLGLLRPNPARRARAEGAGS